MQFAINYSPQAADLIQAGIITVDRFKCPPWPDLIAAASPHCPVCIHFDLRADPQANKEIDPASINEFRTATATPYVNLHLSPDRDRFPDMPLDTTAPNHRAAIEAFLLEGTHAATALFGADQVIVENVPYRGQAGSTLRPAVEPAVIRRIVEDTGCGFLLDISHARLAARHMDMDEYDYLAQMPGEHMRELHVTGIGHAPDGRLTDHLRITEDDWPFLDWVLARIRSGEWAKPWLLAFEYGGIGPLFEWRSETDVIAGQVPRLYEMVHAQD